MQARGRPKGRNCAPYRRKWRGPGGSSHKAEHPRFPVNVADLARRETGLQFWTGTGGAAASITNLEALRAGRLALRRLHRVHARAGGAAARPLYEPVDAAGLAL